MTLEEIERVKQGVEADGWSQAEALLLTAVDELFKHRQLKLEALAGLSEHFNDKQIMDIMAITGMYFVLGCMVNTWVLALVDYVRDALPQGLSREEFEASPGTE